LSLRTKLLSIMVLVVVFCGLVELVVEHWVILPSFLAMEQAEAGKDLALFVHMLQREVDLCGRLPDNALTQPFRGANVQLRPIVENDLSPEDARILKMLTPESPYHFEIISDDILRVFTTFRTVSGRTPLLVQMDTPREISARGKIALLFVRWMAIFAGFMVLFIVTTTMRLTVVGPLTQLTRHVTSIGKEHDLSSLPVVPRMDEVGTLTREFNQMVGRIHEHNEERERVEKALRINEEQLRIVVETAPAGILTLDEEGMVRTFNPAAERLFGYTADEAVGLPLRDLIPGLYETDASAQGEQSVVPLSDQETIALRKDGRTVAVHWTVSESRHEGYRRFTGIVRDISELREMHERVLRTQHLATIGEMASILAHEIRNPLAGISGVVQMLRRKLPLSDERRELMDSVIEQVFRLDGVINQLSALAKLPTPVKQPVDLRAVVEKICLEAEAREPWKEVLFSFEGEDALLASVDVSLFEQVFWKLLGNAADAFEAQRIGMENPPPAEIRCGFEEIGGLAGGERDPAGLARVIISDNGAGMTYDVQEKLFRPFFSTKPDGTGLGLVFCRRVMESHEGAISISSVPGEGTQVTLDFPKGC